MNARGVKVPVLLGGAALTRSYAVKDLGTLYGGPLMYCRDAFDGLHMMDRIMAGDADAARDEQRRNELRREELAARAVKPKETAAPEGPAVAKDNPVPLPPFWGRRTVTDLSPRHLYPFVNEDALFIGQWGFKKKSMSAAEYERLIDETARPVFQRLQRQAEEEGILSPKVVYGYFPVQARGNDLIVYHVEEFLGEGAGRSVPLASPRSTPRERMRFSFPRQKSRRRLCVSDFFRDVESGQYDVLGVQLVTVGDRATELAEQLRAANRYQEYLYLHGFGVESAEALAEFWHKRMRQELGFGSEDAPKVADLFRQGYRGSRYSFGYPACPDLEQRTKIMELLRPADIGVELSEAYMLVPEQSTDALVVHHPQAKYFDVKED
jgi:5-methyltetrahydrofolate--homocysteine methyltransferase